MIYRKRLHRRPDPLILLMFFVIVGLCATISYQLIACTPVDHSEVAVQSPDAGSIGG
ncbi:hypothetical protein [Allochromatium palmeri]|uniref:Uncharacterized protein n=1 Tax=Allochromatium palmeri TaxID=231048 RepID=A0A6N8EE15_9GAMM|nr:hypothetical protein [Allochromatium palmeri]MTW20747.1 hypothetical protein [Allochromatium palmeri]